MDVFFVISGLLVGAHVYEDVITARFSLATFYSRRAKRLLPGLFLVVLVSSLLAILLLSPTELINYGKYSIATVLSATNLFAWRAANYFAPEASQNPLLSAWSLGVEEQFYLIFPLMILLCARARRRSMFIGTCAVLILSASLCISASNNHLAAAFYLLPFRVWEFCAGFLIALYENRRNPGGLRRKPLLSEALSIFGIIAILFSVVGFSDTTIYPGYAALLPVAGATALLLTPHSTFNRYFLASGPMAKVGRISYSLYLWHWPLLSFAHILSDRPLPLRVSCEVDALVVAFALLSYRFIEEPFRKSDTRPTSLMVRYGLLSVAAALPGLLFVLSGGFPGRSPTIVPIDQALKAKAHPCWSEDAVPNLASECVNLSGAGPAIGLLGDSHAEALATEFDRKSSDAGFKLYKFVKSSCPPLQGVTTVHFEISAQVQCLTYNRNTLEFLRHTPGIKLAILAAYWSSPQIDAEGYITDPARHQAPGVQQSDANLSAGLESEVSELQKLGIQVVILRDVPIFRFNPVNRMRAEATPLRAAMVRWLFPEMEENVTSAPYSDTYERADDEVKHVLDAVAAKTGASIFDPKSTLCSSNSCMFSASSLPLYLDRQHVTNLGASYALKRLEINQLLPPPATGQTVAADDGSPRLRAR